MLSEKTWVERCEDLREKIIKFDKYERCNKYLLADIKDTQQANNMSPESPVLGNWFRMRSDVKSHEKQWLQSDNFFEKTKVVGDMCFNAAYMMGGKVEDYSNTFVLQVAACNYDCPYCYVDNRSRIPERVNQVGWFSAKEIVNRFIDFREKYNLNKMRISGGEPGLVPELWWEILQEVEERGMADKVYVFADTNLSTYYLIELLMSQSMNNKLDRNIFKNMSRYKNFGVYASMKGTTSVGMMEAIGANRDKEYLFEIQWRMLKWLINDGLDVYLNLYQQDPEWVIDLFELGESITFESWWYKTWIQPTKLYDVVRSRLKWEDIDCLQRNLDINYQACESVLDKYMKKRFKKGYRQVPRYEVKWR